MTSTMTSTPFITAAHATTTTARSSITTAAILDARKRGRKRRMRRMSSCTSGNLRFPSSGGKTIIDKKRRRETTTTRAASREEFLLVNNTATIEDDEDEDETTFVRTTTRPLPMTTGEKVLRDRLKPKAFWTRRSGGGDDDDDDDDGVEDDGKRREQHEHKHIIIIGIYREILRTRTLPKVEHVSASVYPLCTGIACRLSVKALVPFPPPVNPDELFPVQGSTSSAAKKDSFIPAEITKKALFPLAVFTPGFLVDAESYDFLARRLCSFGYVVLRYDKSESINETLDDVVSASLLEDLITWASYGSGTLSNIVDSEEVLLIGHSRGGKISALESLFDERVKCLALVDPVDNTQYAPLGPGFPSAVMGMESDDREKKKFGPPATLVIGGLKGGECAPLGSNYANFFKAAQVAKKTYQQKSEEPWGFTLDCGHFDFLDEKSFIQSSVCDVGNLDDKVTKEITAAAIAFHADQTFRSKNSSNSSISSSDISNARKAFFEQSKMTFGDNSLVELV
ncbi:unnamed protein product [Bathycoccus prasinos]